MEIAAPLFLSGMGVAVAVIAFYNRDKPARQKDMKAIYVLALGQVALGAMTWFLLRSGGLRPWAGSRAVAVAESGSVVR
jgi:hypothetical protein